MNALPRVAMRTVSTCPAHAAHSFVRLLSVRANDKLLLRLRIPASPHLFYRCEWRGYDEWLGKEVTPLYFRRPGPE
jgi:hypothetical protein